MKKKILNFKFMILKKKIINKSNFFLMQISLLKQIKTKHHWHLVDPSPWPLMASVAAFSLTTGGVLYMHNYILGSSLFKIGLFMLLFVMYTWWRDVVREATFEEHHNVAVQRGLRLGMILFIVSEIMFFFAFFWAFFHSSLSPVFNIGGVWPPEAIITISSSGIPLTNTIFLLSSGATVTWSHHAIRARSKKHTILGLIFTVILAIIFTVLQVYEYFNATFNISDSVFGSCFYMTTGFHGFHVFIGTCCLFVSLFRVVINHFTSTHHFGLESAIWYWHFVDVVWLFLFIMVYWWGC
jgi:heme/copper-type cytochrome/quinol oxidase subunit 3